MANEIHARGGNDHRFVKHDIYELSLRWGWNRETKCSAKLLRIQYRSLLITLSLTSRQSQ